MAIDVIVGYDGSPPASAAIEAGGLLFPQAHAWVTYIWMPPFTSAMLRRRLRAIARNVSDLIEMIEREGEREAERLVATGVALARAADWDADPLVKRAWGGEGLRMAQLAEELQADVVLVGARGLGGTEAVLGGVSDLVVHYSVRPVLVVPHPLLTAEYEALADGPVLVGWDGSEGAQAALTAAIRLFPQRDLLVVSVDEGHGAPPVAPSVAGHQEVLTLRVNSGPGFVSNATSDALIKCANERSAAVIVVGSRGRSAVREILLGSVAMATAHHAHRPVMVVHCS